MSYLALARKWRPKIFSEVIGQEHVVSALSNALDSQRVHHAFLFSGTRGVGKTTLARIFAKALNCEKGISANPCVECAACQGVADGNFVDLIEVDAASRTKVDDTRELLDNVQYTPTLGRYKIYLIDEVHMLSTHSFNALLKTLEEPPEHVKFLFATTHPQKLPATILSRCIQFNLKLVNTKIMMNRLCWILEQEKIEFEVAALSSLCSYANGSVRDALSLLDQAIAYSNSYISIEKVRSMLGTAHQQYLLLLLEQLHQSLGSDLLDSVSKMAEQATDFRSALDDLMNLIHNISLYQVSPQSLQWKNVDEEKLAQLSSLYDAERLQLLFQFAITGKRDFDYAPDPRSAFESVLLRMLVFQPDSVNKSSAITTSVTTVTAAVSAAVKPLSAETPLVSIEAKDIVAEKPEQVIQSSTQHLLITDLNHLLNAERWDKFVTDSGLSGSYKSLLMNMVPTELNGNRLDVDLDKSSQAMFTDRRKQKIEQYFREKLNIDLLLRVNVREIEESYERLTPYRRLEEKKQAARDSASKTFLQDQNVRSFVDIFDAEIVESSIRPPAE